MNESIKINGVIIGDKFIHPKYRKAGLICTIVDFNEVRSMVTGKIGGYVAIYEYETFGEKKTSNIPFATVIRNRIK